MSRAIFSRLLSRKILWRGVVEQARNREAFFFFFRSSRGATDPLCLRSHRLWMQPHSKRTVSAPYSRGGGPATWLFLHYYQPSLSLQLFFFLRSFPLSPFFRCYRSRSARWWFLVSCSQLDSVESCWEFFEYFRWKIWKRRDFVF